MEQKAPKEETASDRKYKHKYGQYPHKILKSLAKSSYSPRETVELKYEISNDGLAEWPVGKVTLQ